MSAAELMIIYQKQLKTLISKKQVQLLYRKICNFNSDQEFQSLNKKLGALSEIITGLISQLEGQHKLLLAQFAKIGNAQQLLQKEKIDCEQLLVNLIKNMIVDIEVRYLNKREISPQLPEEQQKCLDYMKVLDSMKPIAFDQYMMQKQAQILQQKLDVENHLLNQKQIIQEIHNEEVKSDGGQINSRNYQLNHQNLLLSQNENIPLSYQDYETPQRPEDIKSLKNISVQDLDQSDNMIESSPIKEQIPQSSISQSVQSQNIQNLNLNDTNHQEKPQNTLTVLMKESLSNNLQPHSDEQYMGYTKQNKQRQDQNSNDNSVIDQQMSDYYMKLSNFQNSNSEDIRLPLKQIEEDDDYFQEDESMKDYNYDQDGEVNQNLNNNLISVNQVDDSLMAFENPVNNDDVVAPYHGDEYTDFKQQSSEMYQPAPQYYDNQNLYDRYNSNRSLESNYRDQNFGVSHISSPYSSNTMNFNNYQKLKLRYTEIVKHKRGIGFIAVDGVGALFNQLHQQTPQTQYSSLTDNQDISYKQSHQVQLPDMYEQQLTLLNKIKNNEFSPTSTPDQTSFQFIPHKQRHNSEIISKHQQDSAQKLVQQQNSAQPKQGKFVTYYKSIDEAKKLALYASLELDHNNHQKALEYLRKGLASLESNCVGQLQRQN
eukprot:403335143